MSKRKRTDVDIDVDVCVYMKRVRKCSNSYSTYMKYQEELNYLKKIIKDKNRVLEQNQSKIKELMEQNNKFLEDEKRKKEYFCSYII